MRNKILIGILVLMCRMSAQTLDWAPVGAKWYYDLSVGWGGNSYVVYEVEKDTFFQGKWCKKIIMDTSLMTERWVVSLPNLIAYNGYVPIYPSSIPMALTFKENDTIFYYHWSCGKFVPVAHLDLNIGNVWSIMDIRYDESYPLCPAYKTYTVTGINTINFNGNVLREYTLKGSYYCCVSSIKFIEDIGFSAFGLLPVWFSNVVDWVYLGEIRCYYHPQAGWINFRNFPCDTVSKVSDLYSSDGVGSIFIKDNFLHFVLPDYYYPLNIKIYDATGRILIERNHFKETDMSLYSLHNNQIIFIMAETINGLIFKKKLFYDEGN